MALKAPNGFTFIELLVSVAIVMAVTGGVIANYNTYNDSQKARNAILTVKNNLRFAQSRAYNGDKPASGCSQLRGYQVTFTASSYTMQASCTEGLAGEGKTVALESGLAFSPVPSAILFGVLSRGIDTGVTITVTGASQSFQFRVMRSGDMSEVTLAP
ncbi:type II secretion system protein [Candidatus Gottesmanbacteria bacterium]|nr:type II secretion system protein [Candidatus Gottesmanbacteria bacterium]